MIFLSLPAAAQSAGTGGAAGRVTDASGAVLRGVAVRLTGGPGDDVRLLRSDADGEFRFSFLTPGDYELLVEEIGFAPKRLTGIAVRPRQELRLEVPLQPLADGVATTETERFPGSAAAARPGASEWIPTNIVDRLPAPRLTVSEFARAGARVNESLSIEGLPAELSALLVDGTIFRPAAHSLIRSPFRSVAFSARASGAAEVLTNPLDVEAHSSAGGQLGLYSTPGGSRLTGSVRGFWSGSALQPGTSFDTGSLSASDIGAAALLAGPIGDSARFSLGVDARSFETLLAPAWPGSDAAESLATTGDAAGLALDAYRDAAPTQIRSLAGFARVDWSLAEGHRLETGMHFGSRPSFDIVDARTGAITELEATDLLARAALRSRLSTDMTNELTIAATRSSRVTSDTDDVNEVNDVPHTFVANDALGLGTSPLYDGAETVLHAADALHVFTGSHAFRIGAGVTASSHSYDRHVDAGTFHFGDVASLEAGAGAFTRTESPAVNAEWTSTAISLFAQDRWTPGAGVDVLVGVRLDRDQIPDDRVQRDVEWFNLTGLDNTDVDQPAFRVSPRVGLTWDVQQAGRWIVHAAGGIYYDRIDPIALAQWQIDDGSLRVRRVLGTVNWPTAEPAGGSTSPRLTMLGPGFDAPRTMRVSGGITRALTTATTLSLSGVFRTTDYLTRRSDLNLLTETAAHDQYMRPVYGTLVQHGGLLAGAPGSSRRFSAYDEVTALNADGWSDHFGVSASLEHDAGGIGFLGRYTFSRTEDNWFGARTSGRSLEPPLLGDGDDWTEGTSDFDVPHRGLAGVFFDAPLGVRLAALYRIESGRPFTPGFRPGIDANADGVAGNDPAWVDTELPGMAAVLQANPCLRESAGRFADRNSCRGDAVHALDLSLGVRLFAVGAASAGLFVDVLDLIEPRYRAVDSALFLIDPDGELSVDPDTRDAVVPLIVNPAFGEPLTQRHAGRTIRLGLSLNW